MNPTTQNDRTREDRLPRRYSAAQRLLWWGGGLLLVAVAGFLRYKGCFTMPYFSDEAYTMWWSRDYYELWRTWDFSTVRCLKYPVVFILNSFLFDYFDDPVTAIRVVPFVAGVLFFPIFMWLLDKRFGAAVMFISLAILALNPTHIAFSQFARYYSLVFLLANLALFTFYVSFERRSPILFLLSQFFSLLAFLSHPAAGMLVAAEGAYLVVLGAFAWIEGRPILPNRDSFTVTVTAVFAIGCLTLAVASVVILSSWAGVSEFQNNYDVVSFGAGTVLRIGIPLMAFAGVATLYYFFRRSRAGVFFSLALFIPILAGAVLALIGMEVSPAYVAFVIFPGCVLVALFLDELFTLIGGSNDDLRRKAYAGGLVLASTTVVALGNVPELVSYYIDGDRPDYPAAMRWLEEKRDGRSAIVITYASAYPADFCRRNGIPVERLPADTSFDDVLRSLDRNAITVVPYAWWATLSEENVARLKHVPHWLLLSAERDGITPDAPKRIGRYSKAGGAESFTVIFEPREVLKEEYQFDTRIGKTRLDHRQNYLLIYSPVQETRVSHKSKGEGSATPLHP